MSRESPSRARPSAARLKAGFTLVEAMMASVILLIIVIAVSMALTASDAMAFQGQKKTLGALAADGLMAELATLEYDDIRARHGMVQDVGELATLDGVAFPDEPYWPLGRRVSAIETMTEPEGSGVFIRGLDVTVTVFDREHDVASVRAFFPEPAE